MKIAKIIADIQPGEIFKMPSFLYNAGYVLYLKLRDQKAINLHTYELVRSLNERQEVEVLNSTLVLSRQ
jgi:hypothetical protein